MSKATTAISLVLLTAASAGFIGYKAVTGPPDPDFPNFDDNSGADFDDAFSGSPTTNPSTQPYGSRSNSSHGYYTYHTNHFYSPGYSNSFSSSHGDTSPGSSGSHISGTSRGGFGSTGHSMGHGGS